MTTCRKCGCDIDEMDEVCPGCMDRRNCAECGWPESACDCEPDSVKLRYLKQFEMDVPSGDIDEEFKDGFNKGLLVGEAAITEFAELLTIFVALYEKGLSPSQKDIERAKELLKQ